MRLKLSLIIPILVVTAALAAGLLVALVDYNQASHELRRAVEEKLSALLEARAIAISDYLSSIQRDLRSQAENPFVVEALSSFLVGRTELGTDANTALHALYVTRNPYPAAERSRLDHPNDPSIYSLAHNRFHPQLREFADRYGYRDLILLDLDGNVVYSVRKQSDFATDVAKGDRREGGLARAFQAAAANTATGKEVFVDFTPYAPSGGEPTGFVAAPIYGEGHVPTGVLAFEMPVDRINKVMQVAAGLGKTGETLIVGPDLLLRSDSRFDSAPTILRRRVAIDVVQRALSGESGLATSGETLPDGTARSVLVAFQPLDFLGTRWAVAAKADLAEVYAPVKAIRDRAVLNGVGAALLVALVGFVLTRLIVVRPLSEVTRAVRQLAGGERDAPMHLKPRDDEIGDISRALVLFRDSLAERDRLAEEKQREAVLVEAGRRFRAIAEANPVAVLVADARDGTVRYTNPAAAALLGPAANAPATWTLGELFVERAEAGLFVEAVTPGSVDHYETRLRRSDGTEFPAALSGRALEFDGAPSLVIGILDLTERQAAQTQIERQRDMIHQREKLAALGSLLAGVAHELNNPLSVVVGHAMMLQELAPDPATAARGEKIRAAAERCARIVRTFLAMARQRPPQRAAVDVNQAAASAVELLGYSLRTAGIDVHLDLSPELPRVWGDPDQISQVLTNLIVNAEQAMADWSGQKRLDIVTRFHAGDQTIRLAVTDTGPGVPQAIRSRIFEPFFTTKPVGLGTGVGLSVCNGIVEAHGGTIAIEDAPGGGASFVVRLPVDSGNEDTVAAIEREAPTTAGQRALVVDDEPEVTTMLAEILERSGWQVDTADSGQVALEQVLTKEYDVLLSDIRMPNLGGLELYQRLKQLKPELARRFIVVTGDTLSAAVRAFLDETGLPCLEKPFSPEEVRELAAATAAGGAPRKAE